MADARLLHGRLVFEDWSAPDPFSVRLHDALWAMRYQPTDVTDEDRHLVMAAAEAYLHFAGHPAPSKSIVSQLRRLRRTAKEVPRD